MLEQWNIEVKASRNLGITKDRATNNYIRNIRPLGTVGLECCDKILSSSI